MKMKPHFSKTVEEIGQDIQGLEADLQGLEEDLQRLRATRETLVALYGGDGPEEVLTKGNKAKTKSKREPLVTLPMKPELGSKMNKALARLAVLRALPEPFSPESFAVAAGIAKNLAAVGLCAYADRGYLTRVGRGEYQRSEKFPAVT